MVGTENYLDDLGAAEVPDLAEESFRKMGNLLIDLNIEESLSKPCGPCTRMIFLGIIVDTIKMTLELDEKRLSCVTCWKTGVINACQFKAGTKLGWGTQLRFKLY